LTDQNRAELTELSEQLLVADEELRVQQEQLDQTRMVAESAASSYSRLVESSLEALVLTDENGAVIQASPPAQTLVGQVVGTPRLPIPAWFAAPHRRMVRSAISTLKRAGEQSLDLGWLPLRSGDSPAPEVFVSATVVLRVSDQRCRLLWRLAPIPAHGPGLRVAETTSREDSNAVGSDLGPLTDVVLELSQSRSVDEVLEAILVGVRRLIPRVVFSDVYLPDRKAVHRPRPTDSPAQHLNDLQRGLDEGPAVDALAGQEAYSPDLPMDVRWPRLATVIPSNLRTGMAIPLNSASRPVAALVLVSDRPHALSSADQQLARIFALQSGLAVDRATTEESLRAAIHRRQIVGPAIGILAERYHIDTEAAIDALRETSQQTNIKMIELPADILRRRQIPTAVARRAQSHRDR